jgi:adenylate cyclase
VQLIDAETEAHLWADQFETDRAGLAKAQDEITGRLAKTLNVQLIQAASDRIERERAADPDARDLWMRSAARFQRGPLSSVTVQEVLLLDERPLEKDPGSVDAKIGIAAMMDAKLANGWSSSVEQDQERAERLLLEILDREPNNGQPHKMKGILRRFQGRLSEARAELETAIALDPNDTFSLRNLGITLVRMGQPDAAIPYIEKSIRLSPNDPLIAPNYAWLARSHLLLGHLDEAIDLLRKALVTNPRGSFDHLMWLAGALGLRGDLAEAKSAIAHAIELKPEISSIAQFREHTNYTADPAYWALREKTVNVGLRRAGFPDE